MRGRLVVVLFLAACGSSGGRAPETSVALPESIVSAVRRAYPDHVALSCVTRDGKGGPVHTLVLVDGELRVDVEMGDDGEILRERAEVRPEEVPGAILGTVWREFPDARIQSVLRRRRGPEIHYEVRLVDPAGIRSSLALSPAGMIVRDMDGEGVRGGR